MKQSYQFIYHLIVYTYSLQSLARLPISPTSLMIDALKMSKQISYK